MKNALIRNIKIIIPTIIICAVVFTSIGVYATYRYQAKDVGFVPTNENWDVESVEGALNDLYSNAYLKENNVCSDELIGTVWNYPYTGEEQIFTIPCTGVYKLETWGAQGGTYNNLYYGGYGAYATGEIFLDFNTNIYVNVGGAGNKASGNTNVISGGYNGGGLAKAYTDSSVHASGGGATHIALRSGLLMSFENDYTEKVLIVAGAGGGSAYFYGNSSAYYYGIGGNAGGISGNKSNVTQKYYPYKALALGGTQVEPGLGRNGAWAGDNIYKYSESGQFGAGNQKEPTPGNSGGGAGLYGGGSSYHGSGAGGSSYIGNSKLINKEMYCYACTESSDENTKTISVTKADWTAISKSAKLGSGYAKITLLRK